MDTSLGLYEKSMPDYLSWQQKLDVGKRIGFDWLEISIDESDMRLERLKMTKQQRLELLTSTRNSNMYIDTMCLSANRKFPIGSSKADIEQRGIEIMKNAIYLAYDIGVRIIQLAAYDVYYDELSTVSSKERFLDNLHKMTLLAAQNGIILALETMENSFCNTIEKALYYVRTINSPYLKIYPDVGNITNATDNVTCDIRLGAGQIVAIHLKETVPGVYRDMKFGAGKVDFKTIIRVLKSIGVKKYTAEFWYDGGNDWEKHMKLTYDFLTAHLKEY